MKFAVHIPWDKMSHYYPQYAMDAMQRLATPGTELLLVKHQVPRFGVVPSQNHSIALLQAFASIAEIPDAVHIVCDSDTVVVMPNWDRIVLHALESVDCIGTAYQRVGTYQTGAGKKQTYKGKPNIEWLAMKPGKPWHLFQPSKTPSDMAPVMVHTPEDEVMWGLPQGFEVLTDTCWNLPMFMRDQGLTSAVFENIEHLDFIALKGMHVYEEWHHEGVPFIVHQGKSRKNFFRGTPFSKDFYERCDSLLKAAECNVTESQIEWATDSVELTHGRPIGPTDPQDRDDSAPGDGRTDPGEPLPEPVG